MKRGNLICAATSPQHRLFRAALELARTEPNTVKWFDALHSVLLCAAMVADDEKAERSPQ